ncbi:hypothetical protein GUJ93_ZPchr1024g33227 [Zizania palustris]|uniref:Tobamovirus multiplication protein 2B n=1 Tax=Zizania palustris TaxID=103762 RepID=A0A8J5RC68_ZIZPA|nr:hypothetical protein GUJ93_ZPchr1024g33227 [Zizania palustris]
MAAAAGGGGGAQAAVAEQIAQAVQSTSNLSSWSSHPCAGLLPTPFFRPPQPPLAPFARLAKLPKNLLAKVSLAKNTGQVLHQLPGVISSLDAYMDSSLQSASQIKTVKQLLSNMENNQLRSVLPASC